MSHSCFPGLVACEDHPNPNIWNNRPSSLGTLAIGWHVLASSVPPPPADKQLQKAYRGGENPLRPKILGTARYRRKPILLQSSLNHEFSETDQDDEKKTTQQSWRPFTSLFPSRAAPRPRRLPMASRRISKES